MDSAASRQLLKVLSGSHAGGEVLLADGDYVIGSDDASEIVLTDDYVAPRHARLEVRGNSVTCQALDGASILVAGAGTDGAQLAPYQCFTLGSTHLAIGPAESKWPAVNLPDAPVAPPPIPAAARNEADRPDDDDPLAESEQPTSPVVPASAPPAVPTRPDRPKNRGIWAVALGLFALAVATVALILWLVFSEQPTVPIVSREVQQAALQAAVDKLGFGESVAVGDQHGRFIVTGHVPTPADKRAIREAVTALDPATRLRVYDAETLLATVQDFLRMNGLQFTAAVGKPGEIIVGGLLTDVSQWNRVKQRILTDMPQLETLTEDFANVPKVVVASTPAEPAASTPEGPADVATDATAVAATAPEPPQPSQPDASAGPGLPPIQGISVGNTRFITLANGEQVFRGAVLESGYTVKEIEKDRVVLARGASVYIVRIGI